MTTDITPGVLHKKIHESQGMNVLNRLRKRSFSLNIFKMNAVELLEATRSMRDPNQGVELMSDKNRDAGEQAHRELSRHIHNFTASAKTLVDHTRVFIEENYKGTPLEERYCCEIKNTFSDNPVSKFVHDLRNYLVHRGLPNSEMFLQISRNEDDASGGHSLTTGIRFKSSSLLEWSGWTSSAVKFIHDSGEFVDIHDFAENYLTTALRFQGWLDSLLQDFHATELNELRELQDLYLSISQVSEQPPDMDEFFIAGDVELPAFTYTETISAPIDAAANELVQQIGRLTLAHSSPSTFKSQRQHATNISRSDVIGIPTILADDANGQRVLGFIEDGEGLYGFTESDFHRIEDIVEQLHAVPWVRNSISRKFAHDQLLAWCRDRFMLGASMEPFCSFFAEVARKEIRHQTVWTPIAFMEVETEFDFGSVSIRPVTAELLESIASIGSDLSPESRDEADELISKLKHDIQGLAAIVIELDAESGFIEEYGLAISRDVVNLLRFFSPSAPISSLFCPIALLGFESHPVSKLMMISDQSFSYSERIVDGSSLYWQLTSGATDRLRKTGLDKLGALVQPDKLNDFQSAVRRSLITYGKGVAFPDLNDRLSYTWIALESILLKHSMEHAASTVPVRMGLALSTTKQDRAAFSENCRKAYRISEKRHVVAFTPTEEEVIAEFIWNAHHVLRAALANVDSFETRTEFIEAIDRSFGNSTETVEGGSGR